MKAAITKELVFWSIVALLTVWSEAPVCGQELVAVCASWCGPCAEMAPTLAELERSGYKIRHVDFDQQRQWAEQSGVTKVPTFIAFDANGREIGRHVGLASGEELIQLSAQNPPMVPVPPRKNATVDSELGPMPACDTVPIQQPWDDARLVKIRNKCPDGSYDVGSGCIANLNGDSSYVVTAAHTTSGQDDWVVVMFSDGQHFDLAKVLAISPPGSQDCAILKLAHGARHQGFEIADQPLTPGASVQLIGFPSGGQIRSRSSVVTPTPLIGAVEISGEAFQGESGGPILDSSGKLAGVISAANNSITVSCQLAGLRGVAEKCWPQRRQGVVVTPSQPAPTQPTIDTAKLKAEILAELKIEIAGLRGPQGKIGPTGKDGQNGKDAVIDYDKLASIVTVDVDDLAAKIAPKLPPVRVEWETLSGDKLTQERKLGEVIKFKSVEVGVK